MTFGHLDHQSAKQRALRVPLDYVRSSDPVQRCKLAMSILAAAATAGYVGWLIWGPDGRTAFSPGLVAHAHAHWESNCSTCHLDYVAIRSDAANPLARFGFVSQVRGESKESIRHQLDQRCQTCHPGPPHHANEISADAVSCASCHLDHLGRNAEIARPGDVHCTRCHAEIVNHRSAGRSDLTPEIANVTHFSANAPVAGASPHPEFRSLASDPGNVKFNHHMHLTAGIPAADRQGQGRKLMTLADLPAEFVERYRRADQTSGVKPDSEYLVQLDCATCHRTDAKNAVSTTDSSQLPTAGAYMLPVNFDNNCHACHPLHYEPSSDKQIQHGLKPAEARQFLFGRYGMLAGSKKLLESKSRLSPRRRIPGRSPGDFASPGVPTDNDLIAQVAAAEQFLRETNACDKCHVLTSADAAASPLAVPDVEPANIPNIWLRHARFDHEAHRAVKCAECHVTSPAGNSLGPSDHDVVMIKGRDSCMKCHSNSADKSVGGARFDCVECHLYHAPVENSGSQRLTVDQFLEGVRSQRQN